MSIAEKAAAWAEAVAAEDRHGYDQQNRWGPDYDCSSLVISAFEAAGAGVKSRGATYTGNMRPAFLAAGFRDVTGEIALGSGAGLRRGDVLLNIQHHTALYLGRARIVHAAGNEWGGASGGRTGDQTGGEITAAPYFNFPWDCVLRYEGETEEPPSVGSADTSPAGGGREESGEYVVRSGDSLWSIAERLLGSGFRYPELMESSGLVTTAIYPGMKLRLPGKGASPAEPEGTGGECGVSLPILEEGDTLAAVAAAQTLLLLRGCELPDFGADGDFGPETAGAVRLFRARAGLGEGERVDAPVWRALVTGAAGKER